MKSLMAVWKLLILMAMLGSISACSSTSPYQSDSVSRPVVIAPNGGNSLIVSAVHDVYIVSKYGLNNTQKHKQTQAVHTALESDYGKTVYWYERDAMGAVKAVHGYPQGRGFCRVLYSSVTVRGHSREFQETACKKNYESSRWYFVKK